MGNNCCSNGKQDPEEEIELETKKAKERYLLNGAKVIKPKPETMRAVGSHPDDKKSPVPKSPSFSELPLYRKSELDNIEEQTRVVKQGKKIRK